MRTARVWQRLAATSAVTLVTSCTVVVGGPVRPAPDLTPHPVLGESVKKALPNLGQLTAALHQPVGLNANRPPEFGGIDAIPNGLFTNPKSGPRDCIGMVLVAQQNAYREVNAPVQTFANSEWKVDQVSELKAFLVAVSAAAVDTAANADAAFAAFSRQWSGCDGRTVNIFDPNNDTLQSANRISGVRIADSVITASVQEIDLDGSSLLVTRALGVRVNCIIEATVIYAGDPSAGAADTAHVTMDNVSKLS